MQILQADQSINSINFNSTVRTTGIAPLDHDLGSAVDINQINGQTVASLKGSALLSDFQKAVTSISFVRWIGDPDVTGYRASRQACTLTDTPAGDSHENHFHVGFYQR